MLADGLSCSEPLQWLFGDIEVLLFYVLNDLELAVLVVPGVAMSHLNRCCREVFDTVHVGELASKSKSWFDLGVLFFCNPLV